MGFTNYVVIHTCENEWFPAPKLKDVHYDVEDCQQEVAETSSDQAEGHWPETEANSHQNNNTYSNKNIFAYLHLDLWSSKLMLIL